MPAHHATTYPTPHLVTDPSAPRPARPTPSGSTRRRLEEIRTALQAESISYGEIAELQSLAKYIHPADVELREAAGLPEFPDDGDDDGLEPLTALAPGCTVIEYHQPTGAVLYHKPHDGDHGPAYVTARIVGTPAVVEERQPIHVSFYPVPGQALLAAAQVYHGYVGRLLAK